LGTPRSVSVPSVFPVTAFSMTRLGARTTTMAVSWSETSVPWAEKPRTVAVFVRSALTVTVAEQVIDSPASRVVFGHVAAKSSLVSDGVPLSSDTVTFSRATGPLFVTTYV